MKIKKYLLVALSVAAVAAEALPFGAVCVFANPEGEPWRYTYSYFDLTPFGYANFAPFITALLTCALLALAVAFCFTEKKSVATALTVLSCLAALISLLPLLFGVSYFTPLAAMISFMLFAISAVSGFWRCVR